jgi:hypothetical protein
MTLVCQNTLRQTGCSVPQDVVYAFALSFGRVCHFASQNLRNFRVGERAIPVPNVTRNAHAKDCAVQIQRVTHARRTGFSRSFSTVCGFSDAKPRNSAQRDANPNWLKYLASATLRNILKNSEKPSLN